MTDWCIDGTYGIKMYNKYLLESQMGYSRKKEMLEEKKESVTEYYIGLNSGKRSRYLDDVTDEMGAVAYLRFHGVMFAEDEACSYGMSYFVDQMRRAESTPGVKGTITEMHTGGGEVTAAMMMQNAFKEARKPSIIHGHYMASGGVLGSLYADEIILSGPMVQFGSIGVMMDLPKDLLQEYKDNYVRLYSADSPKKNEALREYLEEGTTTLFEKRLQSLDKQFMGQVAKIRNIPMDSEILDGRVVKAHKALEYGVVHGVGDLNYALRRMRSLIRNK